MKGKGHQFIWASALLSLALSCFVIFAANNIMASDVANSIYSAGQINTNTTTTPATKSTESSAVSIDPKTASSGAETADQSLTGNTQGVSNDSAESQSDGADSLSEQTDLKPAFKFKLRRGASLNGKLQISGKVEQAKKVEYYVARKGSLDPKFYLCKARESTKNLWIGRYDFSQLPNGEYVLFAKVKNAYGSYESGSIIIKVENKTPAEQSAGSASAGELQSEPEAAAASSSSSTSASAQSGEQSQEQEAKPEQRKAKQGTGSTATKSSQTQEESQSQETVTEQTPASNSNIDALDKKIKEVRNDKSLSDEEMNLALTKIRRERNLIIKKVTASNVEVDAIIEKDEKDLAEEEKSTKKELMVLLKSDSDGDKLSDFNETRLGTNLYSGDTDADGFLDGDEVMNGYDPKKFSPGDKRDKIIFEEPKTKGETSKVFKVEGVSYAIKELEPGIKEKSIEIKGKALPNSFVTLYIYSDNPVIVTVKSDDEGNWFYELYKSLEDGEHKVYAAVTDNTGKIAAKSEPFGFIKTAEAITAIQTTNAASKATASPLSKSQNDFLKFVVFLSMLSLGLALLSIGLYLKHHAYSSINNTIKGAN